MDKLKTYNPTLDDILHGGIPKYAVTIVMGGPGTGKTVFTLETIFNNARHGAKCIYFTTLSEPAPKLLRYTQAYEFFDESLVGDKIKFVDIGTALRTGGPQQALDEIVQAVEEEQPDIVAIDSFKAIHDLAKDIESARLFVYDLAVSLSLWSITSFLVGEYTMADVPRSPEFAVADAIINMVYELRELVGVRELEVLKLRGSGFNGGRHFFEITPQGLCVYRRIGTIEEDESIVPEERVPSGVPGLDELLHGGLISQSATLLGGATGVGKTLLGLHFMAEGTKQGEKGIIFAFEERPAQLRSIAAGFGINIGKGSGIEILYTSPVEMVMAKWLAEAHDKVMESGAKRVMIDSLSTMQLGLVDDHRFRELMYTAIKMFRAMGVTLIMTMETPELLTASVAGGRGISSITDNIIIMRYVEVESELKRAVAVLKTRGTAHDSELREFTICETGIVVDGPFKQFRGVLTGQPAPVDQAG